MAVAPGHRRTGACPTFDHPVEQRDGVLVRVPLVGGHVDGAQLVALARAARRGTDVVELTNRGNLQLRGFAAEAAVSVLDDLRGAGLGDPAAARVTVSPFSDAYVALRPSLVAALAAVERGDGPRLAPKFVVHIDDVDGRTSDRRAEVSLCPSGGRWRVRVDQIGVAEMGASDVLAVVADVAMLCRGLGGDARVGDAVAAVGRDAVASTEALGRFRWNAALADVAVAPPEVGCAGDGRAVVGARFGRTNAAGLEALASLVTTGIVASCRVTPWRTVLVNAPARRAEVASVCRSAGWLVDATDPAVGIVACIGVKGCFQSSLDTLAEAEAQVRLRAGGAHGTVHVSGCDKRCATRGPVDVTLLGRSDGSGFDRIAS